jgi:sugar lactone lactonase YvrE
MNSVQWKSALLIVVLQMVSVATALTPAANAQNIPKGAVQSVFELPDDAIESPGGGYSYVTTPEGIASDLQGNLYVGRRTTTSAGIVSTIVKISPDGLAIELADLPTTPNPTGVLGLATDPNGNVYAAHNTHTIDKGIYRVSPDGSQVTRLAGSEEMVFPNALTFDARGNLYATDSIVGAIWRFPKDGGPGEMWFADPALLPGPPNPVFGSLPGANGIAFYPPNHLYVANTSKGTISRVDITPQGTASLMPWPVAVNILAPDGIAVDAHGHVFVAIPPGALFGVSPLVKVDPQAGTVTDMVQGLDALKLNLPLSVAFGQGERNHKSVYITSSGLRGPVPGLPGPGIVEVGVGVPGFKGR